MKIKGFLIYVGIIILTSFIFSITFNFIFYPAYISTEIACKVENNIPLNNIEQNSIVATTKYTPSEQTIDITYYQEVSPIVSKHENIHVVQARQNRLFSCYNTASFIYRYFSEVEAYTFSLLPDDIYKIFY